MKSSTLKKILEKIASDLDQTKVNLMRKEIRLGQLESELDKALQNIEHEKALIDQSQGELFGFGEFFELMQQRQKKLLESINSINNEMDLLRDQLKDILSEQKKYEYVLHNYITKKMVEEKKQENQILEEFCRSRKNIN